MIVVMMMVMVMMMSRIRTVSMVVITFNVIMMMTMMLALIVMITMKMMMMMVVTFMGRDISYLTLHLAPRLAPRFQNYTPRSPRPGVIFHDFQIFVPKFES